MDFFAANVIKPPLGFHADLKMKTTLHVVPLPKPGGAHHSPAAAAAAAREASRQATLKANREKKEEKKKLDKQRKADLKAERRANKERKRAKKEAEAGIAQQMKKEDVSAIAQQTVLRAIVGVLLAMYTMFMYSFIGNERSVRAVRLMGPFSLAA